MLEHYESGAFPPHSEPELIAFNGCIVAWARIGRPDKAESILWELDKVSRTCERLVPDVVTYNSVLHALVRSRDKRQALNKAISLVQHMEDNCKEQPAISPDSFTYNTLMKVGGCLPFVLLFGSRESSHCHAHTLSPPFYRLGYRVVSRMLPNKPRRFYRKWKSSRHGMMRSK